MMKAKALVTVGAAGLLTLVAAPAAFAWSGNMSGVLTGFESRRWTVSGGSSEVRFSSCSSVGVGPAQKTTDIEQWEDLTLSPDSRSGDAARLSGCFHGDTSSFTRSLPSGAKAYFRVDRINGEGSGSGLTVKSITVNE